MTPPVLICLCSHPRRDHDTGNGKERCLPGLHPACGCDSYRLDYRSPARGDSSDEEAVEGAA